MMQLEELTVRPSISASHRLLLLVVIALAFAALSDPSDQIFHLKVPAFVAAILLWIYRRGLLGRTITITAWTAILATAVIIPLAWTVLGMLNYGVHSGDEQFATLKSFLFLLILPVLISEDIDLVSLVNRMGSIVAALTFFMVAVSIFSPVIFLALYTFCTEKQNAIITTSRDLLGMGVGQFYYKTSALMIFPFSHYCNRLTEREAKWPVPLLMALIYGAALMCSGSRANMLAAIFVAGAFSLMCIRRIFGLTGCLTIALLGIVFLSTTLVSRFANPDEQSNSIKLAHVRSYEQIFSENPSALLWGQGANTGFYSEGFLDWTTVTELSYLELVRVFGVLLTILFGVGLAWIGYVLFTRGVYSAALAYVAYLAISGSNPLLISSTGFIIICAVWKEVLHPSTIDSAFHLPESHKPKVMLQSGGRLSISQAVEKN